MPDAPGIPGIRLPPKAPGYSKVTMGQEPPTRPGVSAGVVPPPATPPRPRGGQRTPTPAGDRALATAKTVAKRHDELASEVAKLRTLLIQHIADEKTRGDRRLKVTVTTITAAAGVLGAAITVLPPLLLRGEVKAQADISAEHAAQAKLDRQRTLIRQETERAVRKLRAEYQRGLLIDRITAPASRRDPDRR